MSEPRIELLSGPEIRKNLTALAKLRIRVFRDWPYLYEGSLEYEKNYLKVYTKSISSLAVLIWDGKLCVGASTVLPLADAGADAQRPFLEQGHDISTIDYFGESILLPEYRGRGYGVQFFEAREAHAQVMGLPVCAFCAVDRPENHPAKPAGYVANDAFWSRRGYRKEPALKTTFSWPDLGDSEPSAKSMTFWLRDLREKT